MLFTCDIRAIFYSKKDFLDKALKLHSWLIYLHRSNFQWRFFAKNTALFDSYELCVNLFFELLHLESGFFNP